MAGGDTVLSPGLLLLSFCLRWRRRGYAMRLLELGWDSLRGFHVVVLVCG